MTAGTTAAYAVLGVVLLIAVPGCGRAPDGARDAPRTTDDTSHADSLVPAGQVFSGSSQPYAARVALIMEASVAEIEQVRRQTAEADFAVIADDLMFYRAAAQEYLETRGVPVVRLAGKRTLTFLVAGEPQLFDFSREPTLDVVVLYEPGRRPKAVAPADIHEAAEYYGFDELRQTGRERRSR